MTSIMPQEKHPPLAREHLRQVLQKEAGTLRSTLRAFVLQSGLGDDSAADDLLNALTVEALCHADRYDPTQPPLPWLIGIARNLVKRLVAQRSRDHDREPLIRDLIADGDAISDDELFDRLSEAASLNADPARQVESRDAVQALLAGLAEPDREVLRLSILHDLKSEAVGELLGISAMAARKRLYRALNRLRAMHHWKTEVDGHDQ